MFDKTYRPVSDVIRIKCDYSHLPYRIRQKIKALQHQIFEIRRVSQNRFIRLYLFDDACLLFDCLNNKILWTYNYSSSLVVLNALLTDLKRLFDYEKDCFNLKNPIKINDYKSLKMQFYGC